MKNAFFILIAFFLGAGAAWYIASSTVDHSTHESVATSDQSERKILYYRHPHSPRITSDKPMKDEMGMDYIPIYADGNDSGGNGITIAPEVVQNLGVRTAPVSRATITPTIEAFATVAYDEKRLSHVHVRAEGWIERLMVRSLGERVKQGDLLFEWYSPQLVNAQEEYLRALRIGQAGVKQAAHERLLALGIAASTIERLEKQGRPFQLLPVYARANGVVSEIAVRDGMYITPGLDIMTLADLSSTWVYVDLFEHQARHVALGQSASLTLTSLPQTVLRGAVEYLAPELDPQTRTIRARLRFANPDETMKPNMYGRAHIALPARENVLLIPREALIRSGNEERVVLARDAGRFEVARVTSGVESGHEVEILSGLQESDTVVVSAQFLIDSESSLNAAFKRMEPVNSAEAEATDAPLPVMAVWAEGTYHGAGRKEGTINLSHDPIVEFGWPAMKMDLPLAPGVTLGEVAPETPIRFELERLDEITYRILAIKPRSGGGTP